MSLSASDLVVSRRGKNIIDGVNINNRSGKLSAVNWT